MFATNLLTVPSDREHEAWHHFPWARALEAFNIPFLCYTAEGERGYVSPAGQSLLRTEPIGATLGAQADQAARDLGWFNTPVPPGQIALVRELPGWCDGIVLALHVARSHVGAWGAVVVVRPCLNAWANPHQVAGLTPREAQVARLVAAGLATKAVAFRLGISAHTARHHTERVFEKLGVRSRAGVAALLANRMGSSSHVLAATPRSS